MRASAAASALRQLAEYLLAALLLVSALHAGDRAPVLLTAAVLVAGWAAIHDAPLAFSRRVGAGGHRAGLVALGVSVAAAPIATKSVTNLAVAGPAFLTAAVLLQLARPRRRQRQTPAPPSGRSETDVSLARMTGIAASRVGTLMHKRADRFAPSGARQAGRLVGRLASRRPRH